MTGIPRTPTGRRRRVLSSIVALLLAATVLGAIIAGRTPVDAKRNITPIPAAALPETDPPPAALPGVPPAIVELRGYVARPAAPHEAPHRFTAIALRKLAVAIEATQPPGIEAREADAIRRSADRLQVDGSSIEHARITRDAFLAATAAIEQIQRRDFPALAAEMAELRQAAEAVDARQPLIGQGGQTRTFLDRSSRLLVLLGHALGVQTRRLVV